MGIEGFHTMFMNKKMGNNYIDHFIFGKRFILSIFSIVAILYEYFVVTNSGSSPSWGTLNRYNFLFLEITNIQLFLLFCIVGSSLLFISSWKVIDRLNTMFINNKSIQTTGFIFYFLGILSYFHYIVFEPFIVLYLSIVLVLFYYMVTVTISPFYQQNYLGFPFITKYTFWDVNTKNFMEGFITNQRLDIALLLLILTLILQFALVIANTDTGFAVRKNSLLAKLIEKEISLDQTNKNDSRNILALFIVYQYVISLLYLFDNNLFLAFFLLSLIIPVYERKAISSEILRLMSFPIKIYDIYILNFLFIAVLGFLFGIFSQIDQLIFFVLFWFGINIVKIFNTIKRNQKSQERNSIIFKISLYKFFRFLYVVTVILYIASWLVSYDEGFFLTLLIVSTLLRFNIFFRTKIFQKDLFIFALKKFVIYFSPVLILAGFIFFFISFIENGNIFNVINYSMNCPHNGCNFTWLNNTKIIFGMNNPVYIQFFNWIGLFLLGLFGFNFLGFQMNILQDLFLTLEITILPFILTFILLISVNKFPSIHNNWIINKMKSKLAYLFRSIPIFVLSIFVIMPFIYLNLIPIGGFGLNVSPSKNTLFYAWLYKNGIAIHYSLILMNINFFTIDLPTISISSFITWANYDLIFRLILPILTIIIFTLATMSKLYDYSNSKILNSYYILSARASGFDDTTVLTKFIYKNSILTMLYQSKKILVIIFAMDPIFEIIFHWKGIGYDAITLLFYFSIFLLLSTIIIFTGILLICFLVFDILNFILNSNNNKQEIIHIKASNVNISELIETFH